MGSFGNALDSIYSSTASALTSGLNAGGSLLGKITPDVNWSGGHFNSTLDKANRDGGSPNQPPGTLPLNDGNGHTTYVPINSSAQDASGGGGQAGGQQGVGPVGGVGATGDPGGGSPPPPAADGG